MSCFFCKVKLADETTTIMTQIEGCDRLIKKVIAKY